MKFRFTSISIALFLCFSFSATFAKGRNITYGKWWQKQKIVDQLELNSDVIGALEEQHYQSKLVLIELKADLNKNRLILDSILSKEELNVEGANDAFNSLEQSRNKLAKERFRYLLEVRKIIGNENFVNLKMILNSFKKKKRFAKNKKGFKKQSQNAKSE